jgi:hypothetical protein
MVRNGLIALALLICAGCSTVPYKIPLSADTRAKVQSAEVYARTGEKGIGVQFQAQDSSAAGAQYGLNGALVTATIDAIANSGPAGVAEDAAQKLAAGYDPEQLHSELALALSTVLDAASLPGASATVTKLTPDQKLTLKDMRADNVLAVELSYALTQDFRSLHVAGVATVFSKTAAPKTPPKGGEPGMVYRNRFEYWSAPLAAAPVRSQAEIDASVAAVEAKYAGAGKDKQAAYRAELAEAHNPNSAGAQADYLVKQWLANNGAPLRNAIRSGTAEIVTLLATDLADPTNVDVKAKLPASTVVREGNGRVVTRKNLGPFIGELASNSAGYGPPFANATAFRPAPKAPVQKTAAR